jgi:hypothetical protein
MFRYRLRTLLIGLTAIGGCLGWLSWQKRIVANRNVVSRQLEQEKFEALVIWEWEGDSCGEPVKLIVEGDQSRRVSVIRKWLGDENVQSIVLAPHIDFRPITNSFPEADVYYFDP